MRFVMQNDKKSIIKVIGVGGGGSNAVNHMFKKGIEGVDFAVCNTDNQALDQSPVPVKIQLGPSLTDGRGAGSKPNVGKQACIESKAEIEKFLATGTKMLFVTAGMGGGTGTGAAPEIAKIAQEMDILTVGIVSLPFSFEGNKRITQGNEGLEELKKNVDTLVVISNDKMRSIYGNLSMSEAFGKADDILTVAAKGIAEIITVAGYINVDFEDVNTVMRNSGVAIMGTASAEGDDRAKKAVDMALTSPLLEDGCIQGAKHILLNITSGSKEVTMDEITQITDFVQTEAGSDANLIWGNCFDESLGNQIAVTIIATGFDHTDSEKKQDDKTGVIVVPLDGDDNTPSISSISSEGNKGQPIDLEPTRRFNPNPYYPDEVYVSVENKNAQQYGTDQKPKSFMSKADYDSITELTNTGYERGFKLYEDEPAFKRKNVNLETVSSHTEEFTSNYSINESGEAVFGPNKYLHGRPD